MRALRAAFPRTVPILAGFLFLGMAYGVYMHVLGFSFWYPVVMAAVIFGGSLEFVAGTLLLAPFAPVQTFFIALMIQARHLFYGLSMLEKYKGLGWKRAYLIYGLWMRRFPSPIASRTSRGSRRRMACPNFWGWRRRLRCICGSGSSSSRLRAARASTCCSCSSFSNKKEPP